MRYKPNHFFLHKAVVRFLKDNGGLGLSGLNNRFDAFLEFGQSNFNAVVLELLQKAPTDKRDLVTRSAWLGRPDMRRIAREIKIGEPSPYDDWRFKALEAMDDGNQLITSFFKPVAPHESAAVIIDSPDL